MFHVIQNDLNGFGVNIYLWYDLWYVKCSSLRLFEQRTRIYLALYIFVFKYNHYYHMIFSSLKMKSLDLLEVLYSIQCCSFYFFKSIYYLWEIDQGNTKYGIKRTKTHEFHFISIFSLLMPSSRALMLLFSHYYRSIPSAFVICMMKRRTTNAVSIKSSFQ